MLSPAAIGKGEAERERVLADSSFGISARGEHQVTVPTLATPASCGLRDGKRVPLMLGFTAAQAIGDGRRRAAGAGGVTLLARSADDDVRHRADPSRHGARVTERDR